MNVTISLEHACLLVIAAAGIAGDVDGPLSEAMEATLAAEISRIAREPVAAAMVRQALQKVVRETGIKVIKESLE